MHAKKPGPAAGSKAAGGKPHASEAKRQEPEPDPWAISLITSFPDPGEDKVQGDSTLGPPSLS
jgi:hypothetical protein